MRSVWFWVLAFCVATIAGAEDASRPVKIVKVLHDTQPQKRESMLTREIGPNDVGKFKELRADFAPKPDGEYVTVIWKTLSRDPLKNVTVTLYFRQAKNSEVQ